MNAKKMLAVSAALCLVVFSFQQCKDLGSAPGKPPLTASTLIVTLSPGGQATVVISGGNPPYTIRREPNAALATAALTNKPDRTAELVITAVSGAVAGTTSVKVKDSDAHDAPLDAPLHEENEIEIEIRITATVVSFRNDIQPIFTNNCVNVGCHPGGGAPFSLRSDDSYNGLVNVDATMGPCAGIKRVLPGNADNSALIKRLEGTCGTRMPSGADQLSATNIQRIRTWITQGALNN